MRRVLGELGGFIWPYRWYLVFSMLGAMVYAGLAQGRILLLAPLTDKVFFGMAAGVATDGTMTAAAAAAPLTDLASIVLVMLVITLIQGPAGFIRQYFGERMSQHLRIDVQRHIQRHLLKLDMGFYIRHRQGDLMARVLGDMNRVMSSVQFTAVQAPVQFFLMLSGAAVAIYASWLLSLVCLVFVPLLAGGLALLSRRVRHWSRMRQSASGEVIDRLQESLTGIRVVKSFRREDREIDRFNEATGTLLQRGLAAIKYMTMNVAGVDFVYNLLLCGLVMLGGWMVAENMITTGWLVVFIGAMVATYDPIRRMSRAINSYQNAMASAERVFEVLDLQPSITDADDAVSHDALQDGVEFCGVQFDYAAAAAAAGELSWDPRSFSPNGKPIDVPVPVAPVIPQGFNLHDISFRASKGEVIALVGERGSGKSTILDLLLRLYDPTGGRVMIDGVDVRKIKRESLQKLFAVVTQETFLFNTTIADNIRYARPDATAEQVRQAATDANILEFIERQPEGLDTIVGARGARLSGGERQSHAIARALLADAPILVLDEATSNLDSVTERRIQTALERLMEHRTVFVVAHRLSTIQHADRIVVMHRGRIAEVGTHDELLAKGAVYAELYSTQFRLNENLPDGSPDGSAATGEETPLSQRLATMEDGSDDDA